MSIRLRLTLLYSCIVALTVIALSATLYWTSYRATYNLIQERLIADANLLTAAGEFRIDRIILPTGRLTTRETLVQTRDLQGSVTDRTGNLGASVIPLTNQELQAVLGGAQLLRNTTVDGEPLLVLNQSVVVRGRPVGILQVARVLALPEQSLRALRNNLLIGALVVTFLAFGIGLLLSGTVLRPINHITQIARTIGAERDFNRRVEYTGPRDEVGELALTFNTMLAELQAAYQQVEQALDAQRRFVADASHELRTPLTTIRGNISLLQREPPMTMEDRVGALTDMLDETDRLSRLVNNLLVLARVDAGRPLTLEPVPVKPLIDDLFRAVGRLDADHSLHCSNIADEIVIGNTDAVKQVLLILLDNAIKHTPPHTVINVTLHVEGPKVVVSVHDEGLGIDPNRLPHIFDRFYRADSARTGNGTGLGLAIAQTLVIAQHGDLAVTSVVGHGSTFTVTLPRARSITQAEDMPVGVATAG